MLIMSINKTTAIKVHIYKVSLILVYCVTKLLGIDQIKNDYSFSTFL